MKALGVAIGIFAVVGIGETLYFMARAKFNNDVRNLHNWEIDPKGGKGKE